MTSSIPYVPGNWRVGDVVEVKGECTSLDRKLELLRHSWYLAKIKKVEDLIPNLPRFLVQLEDFTAEHVSWVTEDDFRLPLSYESIHDDETVEPGQMVEIASSIDDGQEIEPISWWEATILQDKGQQLKVQFSNENWHDEGQTWKLVDRMDIRKGEPHSSRSWRLETHHSLERTFMKKLSTFMKDRGNNLKYNGGNSLFKVYSAVTAMGGFKKVCSIKGGFTRVWKRCPNYHASNTSGSTNVKEFYIKFLKAFEDEYFSADEEEEEEDSSINTGTIPSQRKRKSVYTNLNFEEEESDSDDEEFNPSTPPQAKKQSKHIGTDTKSSGSGVNNMKTSVDQATQTTSPSTRDASTQTGVVVLFGKEVLV